MGLTASKEEGDELGLGRSPKEEEDEVKKRERLRLKADLEHELERYGANVDEWNTNEGYWNIVKKEMDAIINRLRAECLAKYEGEDDHFANGLTSDKLRGMMNANESNILYTFDRMCDTKRRLEIQKVASEQQIGLLRRRILEYEFELFGIPMNV